MTGRVGIVLNGELQVFDSVDQVAITGFEGEPFAVPAGFPETIRWRNGAFEPIPPSLNGLGILALYRPAQHARAARMLFATYPAGHPQAGQLVDPDALTQRLIDATLALKDPIPLDSPFHVNGTGWMRAIGVIESDEEEARILAGIPPAPAPMLPTQGLV